MSVVGERVGIFFFFNYLIYSMGNFKGDERSVIHVYKAARVMWAPLSEKARASLFLMPVGLLVGPSGLWLCFLPKAPGSADGKDILSLG